MGFLAFSFPWSLGSGVYDEINGGQQKLVCTYLSYISTISFGAHISKTPYQTHGYRGIGLAWCFAYAYTKTNGGDIAQISAHQCSLSSINLLATLEYSLSMLSSVLQYCKTHIIIAVKAYNKISLNTRYIIGKIIWTLC